MERKTKRDRCRFDPRRRRVARFGTELCSDLERLPIERLQAFYRHFYQPDNAALVVAGKIDEASTLAKVDREFSPIPKPTRALRRTYTTEPTQDGERGVTLNRVGDGQAICVAYHVPSGTHEEFAAVQLASSILGTTPSGRLHKALVESGLAVSASAGAQSLMDPGVTLVTATVRSFDSGLLISAIWGIFAVILLVIAVRAHNKLLGQSSLLIFAASVLKILLLDLTGSPSIVRVATLVVAGATLYAGGWLYQRVVRD